MTLSPLSSCHQRTELSTGLLGQIQDFAVGVGGAVGLHGVSQLHCKNRERSLYFNVGSNKIVISRKR